MSRLLILAALLAAAPADAALRRFAVVVAENQPAAGDLKPLRFADDDGVKYAALFRGAGVDTTLLAVLDADTQARHPKAAAASVPPTRAALGTLMAAVGQRIRAARAAGDRTELYIVYAGHADIGPDGEGRMHLRDGTLSRSALLRDVVGASPADFNHVIIDACHAAAMVYRRGEGDDFQPGAYTALVEAYLDRADLKQHPNTGVLLASSARREAHEWSGWRGGVFSHQVRSALTGAADVNGDGALEYSEVAAYVAAANRAITDPDLRPEVVFQPPARALNHPLWRYDGAGARLLRLPGQLGRVWLEDAQGTRVADLHVRSARPVFVALTGQGPHYLHDGEREAVVPAGAQRVEGEALTWREADTARRGAVDDALRRGLFERPYTGDFYDGFVLNLGVPPAVEQGAGPGAHEVAAVEPRFGAWPWISAGVGLAAGVTAAALALHAEAAVDDFEADLNRTGLDDPDARSAIDRERVAAGALTGVAVVGLATALTLWLLDDPTAAPTVIPAPGGVGAAFSF